VEEKREERQIPIMTTRISDRSLFFRMTRDNVLISTNLSLLFPVILKRKFEEELASAM
jgi:hypothetical protein